MNGGLNAGVANYSVFDIEQESRRLEEADRNDQCIKHDYRLPCFALSYQGFAIFDGILSRHLRGKDQTVDLAI
jgi:hypothetical protein